MASSSPPIGRSKVWAVHRTEKKRSGCFQIWYLSPFYKELGLGKFLKSYYFYVVTAGLSQVLLLRENLRGFNLSTKIGLLTQLSAHVPQRDEISNVQVYLLSWESDGSKSYCSKSLLHSMIFFIPSLLYNCCTRYCLGWVTSVILNMS